MGLFAELPSKHNVEDDLTKGRKADLSYYDKCVLKVREGLSSAFQSDGIAKATQNFDGLVHRLHCLEEREVERNKYQIYNLENSIKAEVRDSLDDILYSTYPSDYLNELIDGWIPCGHWELIQYLANDTGLSECDDGGLIENCKDIYSIIGWAMYERLQAAQWEVIQEIKDEKKPFYEYMSQKWSDYEDNIRGENVYLNGRADMANEKMQYFDDLITKLDEL